MRIIVKKCTGRGLFKAHAFTQAHSCGSSGRKAGNQHLVRAFAPGLHPSGVRNSHPGPNSRPNLRFVCFTSPTIEFAVLMLRGMFLGIPLAKSSVERSLLAHF